MVYVVRLLAVLVYSAPFAVWGGVREDEVVEEPRNLLT